MLSGCSPISSMAVAREVFVLTYSTLASIVKYPYASIYSDPRKQKFGFFFDSEKADFEKIAAELGHSPARPTILISLHVTRWFTWWKQPTISATRLWILKMRINSAFLTSEETKNLFLGFFQRRAESTPNGNNEHGDGCK